MQVKLANSNLFKKFNTILKIHSEVNEFPFNSLLFIFFLFQHEHVVVEELLQLLICEVDTKLLEGIELNKLKVKLTVFKTS